MYTILSEISSFLSGPFLEAADSNTAVLAALFLGFIGSVAPCQISANVAAITFFGNRHIQSRLSWAEAGMYILGKVVLFSLFGVLFWFFGQQISRDFIPLFESARKLLGPLLVFIGLFLLGWIRLPFQWGARISGRLQAVAARAGGKGGAFLMGVAFSIGFCPTMFILFFGSLMPLTLQSSYGVLLPPVFAAGTAMPFLLIAGLAVGFGLDRVFMKRAKHWGGWVQKLSGVFFLLLGISDTLTYWTI
ncbi:cytochrome C biosynthesis protein [Paenibacillus darwinianus]|uniref:Cytochrome C biosynthesis protein n=1 Tax=Paenibacillus darwinianus TaxID=1380763 RepID=A0A9W5W786_9BACL|nr:sulfite exporter TauE/SafE family protein [Paenibacillus darwinianus]EXX87935.1 cytochrome C biosynthesis protein [Paenibacillus darwinianus]EXX88353.1 cytochrome C biosynthesis protein [Paenibacillus darwinianus]EXX88393.1 cytochrome C biosynthesis protein [Paenibacillus darwinianus]